MHFRTIFPIPVHFLFLSCNNNFSLFLIKNCNNKFPCFNDQFSRLTIIFTLFSYISFFSFMKFIDAPASGFGITYYINNKVML